MGETKQTIKITEIVDVRDAISSIKEVQDALKKLAIPQNMQDGFDRIFSNVEKQVEKANRAITSGFKTKGSVEAYSNAMSQIVSSYDELTKKINRLNKDKIVLNVDDTPFKKLNEEIDALDSGLKKLAGNIEKLKELKTIANLGTKTGNKVGSWDTFIDAYKKGDIENATKALKVLKGLLTKHNNDENFGSDTNWTNFEKDYKLAAEKLKELDEAQKQYTQDLDLKNAKEKEAIELTEKAADTYNQAKEGAQKGAEGARNFAKETVNAARGSQQLNSELEQFKNKAAYFFGIANGINLLKRAIRSAYSTVKDLDAVMTETAVVTDFDVGDMWAQLPEYTQRANELGVSIHSAYEAATIFYQQGLKTNEVMAVSNETLKMARIAGLDAATASDRMTNALRGFNMEMDKMSAQRVNDVYSKLAAITASNTDEISTAMTKVASLAHNANMEFETTAAFLAQIIESTRESAETAGTALKTVVARFSEVKKLYSKGELLGTDEEGEQIDVNRVAVALRSAGINLNEYLTGAKGLDDIFIELAEKWDSLDIVQQRYIATMAAGSRQQSRFIALMSDYKRTMELVDAANNANGASHEQYGKTLESLETKLSRLKNAWNEFVLGLANSDAIKGAVDLLTGLLTAINKIISTISGKNSTAKMITTFFTAFSAFKVGKAAISKNNTMSAFFGKIVGDSEAISEGSATKIAGAFYSNLATKIADFQKSGGFKGAISNSLNKGITGLNNYFAAPMTSDLRHSLFHDINASMPEMTTEQSKVVQELLKKDSLSVSEFNKTLKDNEIQFEITSENAQKYGVVMQKNDGVIGESVSTMRALSAASVAVGAAFMVLGSQLEKTDKFKTFGTIIKALGAGLMTFGTIMSVYIPLRAELMAQKVTGAIVSIPIIGWITAVISALIALGVAIYNITKNNSFETKLANVSEQAKNAAKAAEDAREAYEQLGEAWENLSDKYNAIENATKGTKEWRDAVTEVNDAVLDLINTYDGIKVSRDENGILRIENQEEIDNRERTKVYSAEGAARIAQIRKIDLQRQEATKSFNDNVFLADAIQAFENAGGKLDDLADKSEVEIEKILNEAAGFGAIDKEDARQLYQYFKENRDTQELLSSQKTALGSTILNEAGVSKELQRYASTFITDNYLDNLLEKTREENIRNYDSKQLKEEYAKRQGYENYKAFTNADSANKDITEAQMRDYLVAEEAIKKASDQITDFTNNLSNFNDEQKAFFAAQEGGALSQEQLEKLQGYTEEDIKKLYESIGGNAAFGEEGLKTFTEQFNNSLTAAAGNFDLSSFSFAFQNNLNKELTAGLTSGTFKGLIDNLWSVYSTSGEESMQKVQKTILDMTKQVKPEKVEDFVKSINSINWASADSVKTLDSLADEYEISEDIVESLKKQIIELNNATSQIDFDKLKTVLGLAKNIGSGKQGRDFSEEDYSLAIANGASKKDFIYNIETGKYDYIGRNLQDVKTAIEYQTKALTTQLEKEVVTGNVVAELIEKYGDPGTDEYKLRSFLGQYISAAGNNAIISSEALQGNRDQLVDAYNKVMAAYINQPDSKEKLEQANKLKYQLNTGSQNASLIQNTDDESARKALVEQLMTSGLPEEIAQRLSKGVMNPTQADNTITEAGNLVDIISQANSFGIKTEDLNTYVAALRQIKGLEDAHIDTLYALAAANARYQDGFKKVIDSYDSWIKLKREDGSIAPEDGNLEQLKAYEQLKKDLKEMFNLSQDISDEFLKSADNVKLLEKATNGDTKAVSQLRNNLAKTNIKPNIDNKSEIEKTIDEMTKQAPDLEFGVSLNDNEFASKLLDLMMQSGAAVEDINKMFESLGWTPPIGYEEVPYETLSKNVEKGAVQIIDPVTGALKTVTTENVSDFQDSGVIKIPTFGDSKFVKPTMPSTKPKANKKGGGGGGSKKKATYWENPYDELYNLQEKINEALRTREALERRYQKLLKQEQATLSDIRKSYYAQITNLRGEADLQKQFATGRLRQINELGNKIYTDDNGNRKTFKSLGVTKYASYNSETGLITIDWEGLDAISKNSSRTNEGKAAEAYISKLEELVSSYEEVRDKLWDIEDEIENLREAAIESYLSFEDRVMEALVNSYQKEIDSYQSMSDAIDKVNSEVIDSLREQVDLSRQIRDNTEKEKEISDMENRLAYLQRDTSGANALEIQKLEKDLANAREGYTDTLVDQAIDKMENDANLAAEQRARQIETMQEQLEIMKDTGALWQSVYDLIDEAAAGDGALSPHANLVELLKNTEAFASLSNIGQAKWWSEVAEEFHAAWVGRGEAEDKYKTDANNDGTIYNSGTSNAVTEVATAPAATPATTTPVATTTSQSKYTDKEKYGVALAVCDGYWGNGVDRKRNLESKGFNYNEIQGIVNKVYKDAMSGAWYGKYYGIKDISQYKMSKFKTGGLADFTGPAWLDGSKTKPELILNAQDSANFIALKDILASLLSAPGAKGGFNSGDNYFDIKIDATIDSDYDVDRLAERIKRDIYQDGQYRNVNTINYLR